MIPTLSFDKTKQLAETLIEKGLVNKVYLQAKRHEVPEGVQIIIESEDDLKDIISNEVPIIGYFRELKPSSFIRVETEGCLANEYNVTNFIRLVIFSESYRPQSHFANRVLSCLTGVTVLQLEVNQFETLEQELGGESAKKIFSDGLTLGVYVDFVYTERVQWELDCDIVSECKFEDLVVCRS